MGVSPMFFFWTSWARRHATVKFKAHGFMSAPVHPFSLDRMVNAVENVRHRLLRTAAVLEAAQVPYAVAGGNAVALWVSRVDEAAVRNTQDVDILLRRDDRRSGPRPPKDFRGFEGSLGTSRA
jgi:hypothetical protein